MKSNPSFEPGSRVFEFDKKILCQNQNHNAQKFAEPNSNQTREPPIQQTNLKPRIQKSSTGDSRKKEAHFQPIRCLQVQAILLTLPASFAISIKKYLKVKRRIVETQIFYHTKI
jgi:hypothetical protein